MNLVQFGIYLIAFVGYGSSLLSLSHAIWAYVDHWRAYLGNDALDSKQEAYKFLTGVVFCVAKAFATVLIIGFLQSITK